MSRRRAAPIVIAIALGALAPAVARGVPVGPQAEPDRDRSRFGVVVQSDPSPEEVAAMREGGVASVRWVIQWPVLQPLPDAEPDWTATDEIVASLAENGIEPTPRIAGSPCYAVDCEAVPGERAARQPPIELERGRRGWATFLGRLVERYGPQGTFWDANPTLPRQPISSWQIWNEQNAPNFYAPRPSPSGYTRLLRLSARAIRSRDPEARIVLGGLAADPGGREATPAPRYLDRLYELRAQRYFDELALHPYAANAEGVERHLRAFREVVERHGDTGTPIWVSELGWGTSEDGQGTHFKTLGAQATVLRQSFGLLALRSGEWDLAGVQWFAWRDRIDDQGCRWCRTAGLLDADGEPKPSWEEFTELAGGSPDEAEELREPDPPAAVVWIAIGVAIAVLAAGAVRLWRRARTRVH